MKIVCATSPNLSHSTMLGWAGAFEDFGIDFILWDSKTKPVFDIFDENQPDMFISAVCDISRGIAQCLKEYPDTITLFHSPSFNEVSEEDKDYMKNLLDDTGKPDYIFSFCDESSLDRTLGGWNSVGYNTLSIMKAANAKLFNKKTFNKNWSSDISIVEDYNEQLNKFILPLCNKNFQFRIFGNGWPVANGVGKPNPENIANVYSSAKICLDITSNVNEPSDTSFNVIASGGYCISNNTILEEVPKFETPQELQNLISKYLIDRPKISPENVLSNHTYHHRISSLLKHLDLEEYLNEVE